MKITRINSERNMEQEVTTIQIKIGDKRYTLTEEFGELRIHGHLDFILVKPSCANEVLVSSYDT